MFEVPVISYWVDLIIIVLFYAFAYKFIQHLTVNPKEYFKFKYESKKINEELKKLSKEQKLDEMKAKQKESFKMVGKQFKMTQKSMFVMMIVALPILWVIKEYYGKIVYDFIIFSVNGLWAYIILGVIVSMIINNIYDKKLGKKYYAEFEK
ncbi:MAG: hypothetical protein PHR26_00645 [Candidatus ainarchaeum sp.]|nr:hypothetical protein [Candidatus ainarchaeum sp.]MDD3975770.1 hypothetical protein [Candidatus ainarchaeum sp.]